MFKKSYWKLSLLWLVIAVFAAACGGRDDTPALPTRVDLGAISASGTETAQPTSTNTRIGPTLPPSWTPAPQVSAATATPNVVLASATATAIPASGTIYYLYNGDSIAAVDVASTESRLIATFGVGVPITGLTLSPDQRLLAYVAPGNGSAREVFVSSLDGTYQQQISCLGFADVRAPAWSADSASLAFIGGQAPNSPLNIYVANFAGSGTCPSGNNQRLVASVDSTFLSEVVWDPNGTRLFFSNNELYAVDLANGSISPALTQTRGFGSDFDLSFNPMNNQLTYLRAERNLTTGAEGGLAFQLDVTSTAQLAPAQTLPATLASHVEWSRDGRYFLASEADSVYIFDAQEQNVQTLLSGLVVPPNAIFSPDAALIAYLAVDPVNPSLQQIFVLDRAAETMRQITFITEGAISTLQWAVTPPS
ncbi:MAG: hypothetical protein H7Y09_14410 [Chitinophagaceae bacterium]|nr:hypothetical protein [Anaerolineae bacterium]